MRRRRAARRDDHPAAAEQRGKHGRHETMHVEQRHRHERHVLGAEARSALRSRARRPSGCGARAGPAWGGSWCRSCGARATSSGCAGSNCAVELDRSPSRAAPHRPRDELAIAARRLPAPPAGRLASPAGEERERREVLQIEERTRRVVYAGFSGAAAAPSAATASRTWMNSGPFGSTSETRSPRAMPRLRSSRATRVTPSSTCPAVSAVPSSGARPRRAPGLPPRESRATYRARWVP